MVALPMRRWVAVFGADALMTAEPFAALELARWGRQRRSAQLLNVLLEGAFKFFGARFLGAAASILTEVLAIRAIGRCDAYSTRGSIVRSRNDQLPRKGIETVLNIVFSKNVGGRND